MITLITMIKPYLFLDLKSLLFHFHFSKRVNGIFISFCTSREKWTIFFYFFFTFHFSIVQNPLSLDTGGKKKIELKKKEFLLVLVWGPRGPKNIILFTKAEDPDVTLLKKARQEKKVTNTWVLIRMKRKRHKEIVFNCSGQAVSRGQLQESRR